MSVRVGVQVHLRRAQMRLILRLLCTRKTESLDAIVERLVNQANSGGDFDLSAVPSGYPLSAITVDMATSAFELMHGTQFGALFHHLCGEKTAKAWTRRAQSCRGLCYSR